MLIKTEVVGPYKIVQVRTTADGKHHRHVILPGQDFADEHEDVRAVCSREHTPEVVAAYEARLQVGLP